MRSSHSENPTVIHGYRCKVSSILRQNFTSHRPISGLAFCNLSSLAATRKLHIVTSFFIRPPGIGHHPAAIKVISSQTSLYNINYHLILERDKEWGSTNLHYVAQRDSWQYSCVWLSDAKCIVLMDLTGVKDLDPHASESGSLHCWDLISSWTTEDPSPTMPSVTDSLFSTLRCVHHNLRQCIISSFSFCWPHRPATSAVKTGRSLYR